MKTYKQPNLHKIAQFKYVYIDVVKIVIIDIEGNCDII